MKGFESDNDFDQEEVDQSEETPTPNRRDTSNSIRKVTWTISLTNSPFSEYDELDIEEVGKPELDL